MLIIEKNINKGYEHWENCRNNLRISQGLNVAQPIPKLHLWALAIWKNGPQISAVLAIFRNPNMGGHIYTLGGYEANIKTEGGIDLLEAVGNRLRKAGAKKVIGPMLGSTWYNYGYRSNGERAIVSEETFLPIYIEFWEKAGFVKDKEYYNYLVNPLPSFEIQEKINGLRDFDISIQHKDQIDPEILVDKLYDFLHLSFRKAYLFTPLEKKTFVEKYLPFCGKSKDSIFWFATVKEKIVAIAFGFKNSLAENSYVLKTLARDPIFPVKAIGKLMGFYFSNECKKLGGKDIILANIREDNFSLLLAKELDAKQINTITLYKKQLS